MLDLSHGGQVLTDDAPGGQIAVQAAARVAVPGDLVVTSQEPPGTPFDYLFPKLKKKAGAHLPGEPKKVVDDLNALGAAMSDASPPTQSNSTIPAVYVYWGQFIDHDITANTNAVGNTNTTDITQIADNGPASPDEVTQDLRNLRKPRLDLDSVYGDGPAFLNANENDGGFYDGARFRVGNNHEAGIPKPNELGERIPPVGDLRIRR